MGIEKLEPTVPRKDVDRRIHILRKEQIRNTGLRFRFQMIIQRYNTYQTYWRRICREIENGTYRRHVLRAAALRREGSADDCRAEKSFALRCARESSGRARAGTTRAQTRSGRREPASGGEPRAGHPRGGAERGRTSLGRSDSGATFCAHAAAVGFGDAVGACRSQGRGRGARFLSRASERSPRSRPR